MGGNRGKISLQPIANGKARRVTFVKRKNCLKKKLHELTTLCGIDAGMICIEDGGSVETWPENQAQFNGVIHKYKQLGRNEREKNSVNIESLLEERKNKLEDELDRLRQENGDIFNPSWDQGLDNLSKEGLTELGFLLDSQMEKVKERVNRLMNHQDRYSALVDQPLSLFGDSSMLIGGPPNNYDDQHYTMEGNDYGCYVDNFDEQSDFLGEAMPWPQLRF